MTQTELDEILTKHSKWLRDEDGGEWADLSGADLHMANLHMADLRGADLHMADLDYSCWPLSCRSNHVKVDARIAAQLAAHFCVLDCEDPGYRAARAAVLDFAKTSHRAKDLGLIGEQS